MNALDGLDRCAKQLATMRQLEPRRPANLRQWCNSSSRPLKAIDGSVPRLDRWDTLIVHFPIVAPSFDAVPPVVQSRIRVAGFTPLV